MRNTALLSAVLVSALLGGAPTAQSNQIPGTDLRLADAFGFGHRGRLGVFPNGVNGFSAGVTVCNIGTVTLDWRAPMDDRHPMYAFLVTREADGRFEQISDRSYVKHGFASINANFCGTCRTSNGSLLGPSCSDTYGAGLNADRYWLGPQEEIDPWLAAWNPVGSHFDRGEPDVGAPANMDGRRSLLRSQSDNMDPVRHRITVSDADLNVPNANFYYGIYIVGRGEPEANRENNMITRRLNANWTGSLWSMTEVGGISNGTILQHWNGARLSSVANGNDDGRFHVAVKVTGPDERGMWRYEYAIHNRDNSRGGAGFRIPVCPDARIENVYFKDIDGDPMTDWSVSRTAREFAFLAPAGNAHEWNTIFNFGFDCDAGPVRGDATIDQARPGPGAMQLTVNTEVPGLVFSPYTGPGCGAPAPELYATGTPPMATIPNPTFGLRIEGMAPNASGALVYNLAPGSTPLTGGCTLHMPLTGLENYGSFAADAQGVAFAPQSVPNMPALEGASIYFQAIELLNGGPLYGAGELSNGLQIRIGNQTSGCR